jgi:hypothetical protein
MADRLNDTDPESPNALVHRTDPGLGEVLAPAAMTASRDAALAIAAARATPVELSPVPPVPTPSPGSASIEELIDGITGPRPPPPSSRREAAAAAADSARAYAAARPAPASHPLSPAEPLVVSPDPPLYSGAGRAPRDLEIPQMVQPESAPPVVRKPAEERTVFTGRRALVRKLAVVMASSAAVAMIMMTTMRWKEAQRPHRPSEVVVLPAAPEESQDPSARVSAGAAQVTATPVAVAPPVVVPAATASVTPAATAAAAVPVAKPAVSAQKRVRPEAKPVPQQDGLDDLNRQIRH